MSDRTAMALRTRLSWAAAGDLAREIGDAPRSTEERAARARCWQTLELFEPAWNELVSLERDLAPGRLRVRVRADLLILSYYLARQVDETAFAEAIEREAGADLQILTDLHLGLGLRAAARNDLHEALRQSHFGLDLAKATHHEGDDPRRLLPLLRLHAHLLAQAASYREALRIAEDACSAARRLGDAWEIGRSTYTKGFVLWCQGRPRAAVREFDEALGLVEGAGSSLPRWIRCSRARALAMLGRIAEAEADLAASSHHLPEDLAYVALVKGEPEVARTVLEPHVSGGDPFVLALYGITQSLRGDTRAGEEHLAAASVRFAAGGLLHYALSTQIHLGFCREQRRQGSGRAHARRAAMELVAGEARTFAWPHPAVRSWVSRLATAEPCLALFCRSDEDGREELAVPLAVRLHSLGLTAREAEVALRVLGRADQPDVPPRARESLAADLGISPNTLRVHLMRIRAKLGVSGARGDKALAAALDRDELKEATPGARS